MVQGVEDLRTPLRTSYISNHTSGALLLASCRRHLLLFCTAGLKSVSHQHMRATIRTPVCPGLLRRGAKGDTVHEYYDPLWSFQGANKWAEVKDGVFKIDERMLGLDLARDSALSS